MQVPHLHSLFSHSQSPNPLGCWLVQVKFVPKQPVVHIADHLAILIASQRCDEKTPDAQQDPQMQGNLILEKLGK